MDYTSDLIAAMEDKIAEQERRIAELTEERDRQAILIAAQDENVGEVLDLIDRWEETFDLTSAKRCGELLDQYNALRIQHNKLVRNWNARYVPRNFGRPLAASPAQQADVLARRGRGESLRDIERNTGLGLQTVRTIIDKKDGVDRATMRRLAEIAPDKMREARDRAARRTAKMLPMQAKVLAEKGAELRKAAKGLGA